jgi:PmbA protein
MNDDVLDIFARALRAFGGDAELAYHGTRDGTTRFANSRVTQTADVRDQVIQARVGVGNRVGAARVNALDASSLAEALGEARAIAERLPDGDFAGFDDGSAPTPACADSHDALTAAVDADARASLIRHAFAACAREKMTAAGSCAAGETRVAVANSRGCRREHRYTRARFDFIAADDTSSGRSSRDGGTWTRVGDGAEEFCAGVVESAVRSRDPLTLPAGAYDVILEPHAMAELVEWMGIIAFSARALADGCSPLAERIGQSITGALTFYDDALSGDCDAPTLPFDAEGTPRQKIAFVDGGIARAVAHDRASAKAAGTSSTGHAAPIGDELSEGAPAPMHTMIAAGSDEDLVARVERGLYVKRFHYVNGLVDTRRALMTGMTRDGVWLVENGRVTRSVANLRWTESLLEAGQRLGGISRARSLVAAGLNEGWFVCPTILFRGWKFGS